MASKGLTVVFMIVAAAVAGDQLLGAMAHGAPPSQAEMSDAKDLLKTDKSGKMADARSAKPQSEIGKNLQPVIVKMQDARADFERELKAHPIDGMLDWKTISTAEGRAKNLAALDANYEVYKKFYTLGWNLRKELMEVTHSKSTNLFEASAREGKLFRSQGELYAKYREVIAAVTKAKLVTKNGEVCFAGKAECQVYQKALDECRTMEQNYDDAFRQLAQQERDIAQGARERLAGY